MTEINPVLENQITDLKSLLSQRDNQMSLMLDIFKNCSYTSLLNKDFENFKFFTENTLENIISKTNQTGGTFVSLVLNLCFLVFLLYLCMSKYYKTRRQKLLDDREHA